MTMTTVGYGDITPNTNLERVTAVRYSIDFHCFATVLRLFCILFGPMLMKVVCMLLGGYTFGMVVGLMSEITRNASFGTIFD